MNEPRPACPLCGNQNKQPFDTRRFRDQLVTNVMCAACGCVYQSPRMSEQALEAFYAQEYRQLYQGGDEPNSKDLQVQRLRAAALLDFVRPHIQTLGAHLDIGCSAGLLLQQFASHYGCKPAGIEPGNAYRRYASQQGLDVVASLQDLKAHLNQRFDLVSLAHVLEHLADPVGYLSAVREELLARDGWLLVEVPNLYCHDSFEVAHLVSYSPHTLQQVLAKAGYKTIRFEQHGRPRSANLPLYLTVLAKPTGEALAVGVPPERGVRFKRRLGLLRRAILTRLAPRKAWLQLM